MEMLLFPLLLLLLLFCDVSVNALRVLLLVEPTPFTYTSGYANRFKETLTHLHQEGDVVHIHVPDSGTRAPPPPQFLSYNITTTRGFELPMYQQVTLTLDSDFHIPKLIEEFKPELIHCVTPSCICLPTIFWAKHYYNIPLVFSYHTDLLEYSRNYVSRHGAMDAMIKFLIKSVHDHADLTLCTSPQLKQHMVKEIGLDESRVDVWKKGINTDVFSPTFKSAAMRKRLMQGNNNSNNKDVDLTAPLLLYVGRLGLEKQIQRLKHVLLDLPSSHLAIVGEGPADTVLRKCFDDDFANVTDRVHFMGNMQGRELSEAFASADVFCMPSDSETLGFVVIEAMASGVPVVGVNAGGLPDIIVDNITGFLVSNNDDMVQFSDRVAFLTNVNNKPVVEKMAAAARSLVESWSWEGATKHLRETQYLQAIRNHQLRGKIASDQLSSTTATEEKAQPKARWWTNPFSRFL